MPYSNPDSQLEITLGLNHLVWYGNRLMVTGGGGGDETKIQGVRFKVPMS